MLTKIERERNKERGTHTHMHIHTCILPHAYVHENNMCAYT